MSDVKKNCFNCNHCGMDMDLDPYCAHPTVLKDHPYGNVVRRALPLYCGIEERKLWEPRER